MHVPHVDYDIEMTKLLAKNEASSVAMTSKTGYKIACFAEDDWVIEADAATNSVSYGISGYAPNFGDLAATNALRDAIGVVTTLDLL